ncbi:MAG: pimeloyl-[acyl-carrier protein] methyl ester esterase [Pseudomonadota bacterium]|nr:pimeloyl-[acyl-carrier protein] methyl ester esterase [Pseudomonadota bacterium]
MSLRITTTGSGPDVALLHGWGLGAGVWEAMAAALSASCHVHLVSLAGYDGQAADDLDFAETAVTLADQLPAGCTLCGWSLGGMLALSAAAQRPQRIGRLALVSTTPRFVQDADWPHAQPPSLLDGFRDAVAGDVKATLTRFVMLFNQGDEKARPITRALTPLLGNALPDRETLLRGLDWLGSVDLRSTLKDIAQPALVMHGNNDPLMPFATAAALAERLPQARLQHFAGAAHAPFIADPTAFTDAVSAFCHATP